MPLGQPLGDDWSPRWTQASMEAVATGSGGLFVPMVTSVHSWTRGSGRGERSAGLNRATRCGRGGGCCRFVASLVWRVVAPPTGRAPMEKADTVQVLKPHGVFERRSQSDHRQGAQHVQGRRRSKVDFAGGERSATRFANSSITANLIENDQEVQITVYYGKKTATATTHQFDDASLKRTIDAVQALAQRKPENPEVMPLVKPPQQYIEIDAALPSAVNFGPAERAQMVQGQHRHLREEGRARRRLHPEVRLGGGERQLRGPVHLLPLRRRQLHPDVPHARPDRVGLGGHDRREGHREHRRRDADRGGGRQGPEVGQAARDRARQLHGDPRAAAGGALSVADARRAQRARTPRRAGAS